MGTFTPDAVKRLVDHFDRERRVYQSPDYKEEQLRAEFLNPFFTAVGWDLDDTIDAIRARNCVDAPLFLGSPTEQARQPDAPDVGTHKKEVIL